MVMSSLIYIGVATIWISVVLVTPTRARERTQMATPPPEHSSGSGLNDTQKDGELIRTILNSNRYNIYSQPRRNPNHAVDVNITLEVNKLRTLDFTTQTMEWMGWLEVEWHDEFLQWDPSKYNNVKQFFVPAPNIWTPDVLPLDSVNDNFNVIQVLSSTQAEVHHTGRVVWMTTSMFITSCVVNVALFPFDVQHCKVHFGSRIHKVPQLMLSSKTQDASYKSMHPNGQWHVEGIPVTQSNKTYACCQGSYSTLTYNFILRRKPMFFLYNLLFPGLLVLLVGVAAFVMPVDSGDKVSLAITALLTMMVFQLVVMDNIPPNSDSVPLLSVFFGVTTAMLALSTVMTVVVAVVGNLGTSGRCPPRRLGVLLSGRLARYLVLPSADWTQEIRDKRETNEFGDQCVEQWMVVATFVDRIGFLVVVIGLMLLVVGLFYQVE